MKKTKILCLLLILFLSGCSVREYTLDNGRYVIPSHDTECPFISIHNGDFNVIQSIAHDYQPSGKIERHGNRIVMESLFADEEYIWTFQLVDNNTLKFISNKSEIPNKEFEIIDGTVFTIEEMIEQWNNFL